MKRILRKPVFLVLNFILLLFAILIAIYFLGSNVLTNLQTKIILTEKESAVDQIQHEIASVDSILMSVSSYISTQSNPDVFRNYLIDLNNDNEFVTQLYFGAPDNTWIITSEFTPPPGFDVTTRPWYVDAVAAGDISYTDAYVDAVEDRIVVSAAYPVYKDSQLIGVVGADIEIREITSFINAIADDYNGIGFVLDGSNQVIAHKDLDHNSIILQDAENYQIPINEMTDQSGMTDTVEINQVRGKVFYSNIDGTDYKFGLFIPSTELNQSLKTFSLFSVVVLGIFLLVVAVVFMIFQYFIFRPISYLINDIRLIDPVTKPKYRLPEAGGSQFNNARAVINELIDKTVEYQFQSENRLQEIRLRNQKINMLLESSPDIVFQLDIEGRYLEIYGRRLAYLGWTEKDFIGKTFNEVFKDAPDPRRTRIYKNVLSGNKEVFTWEYSVNDIKSFFETSLLPVHDIKNNVIGIVGVTRDITEQQLRYEELLYISTHDHLTELYNRRYYYTKMDELDEAKQYPFAVFNIDVNGLKIINDAYGHAIGDLTLKKTAKILLENTNDSDIVSRVSGDEFTILVPNSTKSSVVKLKSKLQKAFSKVKINNMSISVAIGFYLKEDDSVDVDEVRKLAENDMFRHKITEHKSVKNKAISAILKTLTDKYEAERIHSDRVSQLSYDLGKAVGLEEDDLQALKTAAMFHDIGKISIPDEILNKPGRLTKEEFEIMKTHTDIGYEILRAADEYSELAIHASSHHERYDGAGYPRGLKGQQIPEFSRIICICDAYEAMTSDRSYRKRMSDEYAVSEIIKNAGKQFDPKLAEIFVKKVLQKEWFEDKKH